MIVWTKSTIYLNIGWQLSSIYMFTENYQHYWNRISHFSLESIWKECPPHLTPACLIMHPITNPYPQIQPNAEKRRWNYPCFRPFPCCTVNRVLAKLHLTHPFFTDTSLPIWFFLLPWNWRRSSLFPILATAACLFFVLCKSYYFEESSDDSAWRHTGQRKGIECSAYLLHSNHRLPTPQFKRTAGEVATWTVDVSHEDCYQARIVIDDALTVVGEGIASNR